MAKWLLNEFVRIQQIPAMSELVHSLYTVKITFGLEKIIKINFDKKSQKNCLDEKVQRKLDSWKDKFFWQEHKILPEKFFGWEKKLLW